MQVQPRKDGNKVMVNSRSQTVSYMKAHLIRVNSTEKELYTIQMG